MNGERYQQAMSQIGRYELVAEIARGGMGVVYQAYEPALERRLLLGAAGGLAVVAVTLLAMLLARVSGGGAIGLSAPRAGVPSPRQVVWSYAGDRGLAGGPAPLAAEGMVIVGTLDGRIVALHAASGELSWSAGGDSTVLFGAPSASGELVFVGSTDGLVQGLSLRSGKATWQTRVVGVAQEAPALDGGRLIVTTDKGYIYMLQAGSGQVIWDRPLAPSRRPRAARSMSPTSRAALPRSASPAPVCSGASRPAPRSWLLRCSPTDGSSSAPPMAASIASRPAMARSSPASSSAAASLERPPSPMV